MNKTIRQKMLELAIRLREAVNVADDQRLMYGEHWDGSNFLNVIEELATEMVRVVEDMMEHDKE